jgi:phosphoribosylanthranilate isomerase
LDLRNDFSILEMGQLAFSMGLEIVEKSDKKYLMNRAPHWPPTIQVAGVSSLEESLFCAKQGIDALGFTIGLPGGPHDGVTERMVSQFRGNIPYQMIVVLITYLNDIKALARICKSMDAHAVQFHGGIEKSALCELKTLIPHLRAIGRITVTDENSFSEMATFQPPLWDAIILDSYDPFTGKRGATGKTHDWSISARIVREARIPVILAGGLNPDNVAAAIARVRPAGVDAHTGLEGPGGCRDYYKISRFAAYAKQAFEMLR